jgi:uncharacterized protein YceK
MRLFTALPLAMLLLSGCATVCSDYNIRTIAPTVKKYPQETLNKAADEIDGGKCPILGNVMMPDYKVCRDQSRAIK